MAASTSSILTGWLASTSTSTTGSLSGTLMSVTKPPSVVTNVPSSSSWVASCAASICPPASITFSLVPTLSSPSYCTIVPSFSFASINLCSAFSFNLMREITSLMSCVKLIAFLFIKYIKLNVCH